MKDTKLFFCQFNEVQSNDLYEERDSQEEIDSFIRERKSLNTVKKTASDMNSFNRYLAEINKQYLNILHLPAQELDRLLSKFFKDIRKFNGEEYEPNTISSFERSIERFLSDNKSQFNILRDKKFEMSCQVLASKTKAFGKQSLFHEAPSVNSLKLPTNDFYSNEIQQRFPSKYILHFRYTILSKTCGHYFLKSHTLL